MKKKNKFRIYPLITIGILLLVFINSCNEDETTSKKNPTITWANPLDISFGTLLSAKQLNATSDVPGTFFYTPAIGTKLDEGANQNLKVDFIPTDVVTYNTTSKTVKINVVALPAGSVIDIDGNVYTTITIGTQVWMVENLKTTRYRNGDSIPNITDGTVWFNLSTGAYGNYNNDENNSTTYGKLYNWYAIADSRNLCPIGWHIPTNAEWTALTTYLGGESLAGGKLKEAGTTHWSSPNREATNETGFTALPGGIRGTGGSFSNLGDYGYFWTATVYLSYSAIYRYLYTFGGGVTLSFDAKRCGLSVRCIKN